MSEKAKHFIEIPRRVLVVDDDAGLRHLIVRTLRREGYETCEVQDGSEAVRCAESDPFLVLLLDQKLPDMQGSDIVRILGERGIKASFIMMTGHGDERLAVEMMKQGAADYLIKDTGFIDLLPGVLDRVFRNIETEKKLRAAEEEKEKLQAQLYQAQKLESIGRLAGGVAHDFNNMLGVIIGHAELSIDMVTHESELFSHLHEILMAAEHSVELTQQLLAFARRQTVVQSVFNLNTSVEKILKMLKRMIGEDIELVWQPGSDAGNVRMDSSQIDQILANLCVNARDAINGNGRIIIETGTASLDEIEFTDTPEPDINDYILLKVSDNGCGIDALTMHQIFEPFFTTKESGKGTGLGLATVYGIVKQNKGLINVCSEPGKGASFMIYLPRHTVDDKEVLKPLNDKKTLAKGNETILLLEDEPSFLNVTREMLKQLGYNVICSSTCEEAEAILNEKETGIDLLLTDVIMPGMNGDELARRIKASRPEIRCILMSGYTGSHCMPDDYLLIRKPFSIKSLSDRIKEALSIKN